MGCANLERFAQGDNFGVQAFGVSSNLAMERNGREVKGGKWIGPAKGLLERELACDCPAGKTILNISVANLLTVPVLGRSCEAAESPREQGLSGRDFVELAVVMNW